MAPFESSARARPTTARVTTHNSQVVHATWRQPTGHRPVARSPGPADLPSRAIREQITSALDLVVHVRRYEDGVRRIASISEVTGLESGTPLLQDLFVYRTYGSRQGRLEGRFEATGIVPQFVHSLRAAGEDVPLEIFQEPTTQPGGDR